MQKLHRDYANMEDEVFDLNSIADRKFVDHLAAELSITEIEQVKRNFIITVFEDSSWMLFFQISNDIGVESFMANRLNRIVDTRFIDKGH